MTMMTSFFMSRKNAGKIKKTIKKAVFYDGLKRLERTIYEDVEDGKLFVILDREAHKFRPSKYQPEDYRIFGYIH